MKFFRKGTNPTFWVEDYTEEDKLFLTGLGFQEELVTSRETIISQTMYFSGSGYFESWSVEEGRAITNAIKEYLDVEKLSITTLTLQDLL